MFAKLFPYKLHLHIFQLEEYNGGKLVQWVISHFWIRNLENKKPLVWTQKAKALYCLAILFASLVLLCFTVILKFIGLVLGLLLATQAYLFLLLASYFLFPLEIYQKNKIKKLTRQKLQSLKNLKIIGITGSYGKTSVKEFLYQILKTQYKVLKTPGSYNTPYGIAKVVDLELNDDYEYFVCEMGAYKRGDIKEICDIVHPKYAVLTGINEQHLESFGSLENTTITKFELITSLPTNGFGIVNIDNKYIREDFQKYKVNLITYGFTDEKFSVRKVKQTPQGSTFMLLFDGKVYDAKTLLLGIPNIQNILAAATMSFLLGMQPKAIVSAIANLAPIPHRLEIKEQEYMTIIDDAYNSNVDGFREAIHLLKLFTNRPKIIVTPGIVGLGNKTLEIHRELGKLLIDLDYVFLVGKSERTDGLKEGMQKKGKIIELKTIKDVWEHIEHLNLKRPAVLLENDLPDNY